MERSRFAVVLGLVILGTTSVRAEDVKPPTGEFQRSVSAPRVSAADLLTTPSLLGQFQPEDKDKKDKDKKDKKTAPPLEDLAQLPPTPTEAPRAASTPTCSATSSASTASPRCPCPPRHASS